MRAIPPMTGDSMAITPVMLTSSSVVEAAPAAYAGGTTYALGDMVSVAAGNPISVYQSLQAANTGHTPASSPTWWVLIGTTYAAYNIGTTYAAGDIVLDATNHLEYTSLIDGNVGNPVTDATKWFLDSSNRYRMWDLEANTVSTCPSPMVVVVTPGQRVNALAFFGLDAASIEVSVKVGGVEKYNYTASLSERTTTTWTDYFFGAFSFKSRLALFDLPPFTGATITVTLTKVGGQVSCGSCVPGMAVYLGEAELDPVSDAQNFSSVDRDIDGTASLIRRRSVPTTSQVVWCEKANVNKARRLRDDTNALPTVWSTLDDNTDGYHQSFLILGVATRFSIDAAEIDVAKITIEAEDI